MTKPDWVERVDRMTKPDWVDVCLYIACFVYVVINGVVWF